MRITIRPAPASDGDPGAAPIAARPVYFPVSLRKFALLSIFSAGLYNLFWFYRQWGHEQRRTGEELSPFWRTVWRVFFCYSLAERIEDATRRHRVRGLTAPGALLASAYAAMFVVTLFDRDRFWWVMLGSCAPLLPMQAAANRVNSIATPGAPRNDRFTGWNVLLVVIGALILGLALVGTLLPDPAVVPTSGTPDLG